MKKSFKWIAAILIVASIFSFMGCPNEPELPSGGQGSENVNGGNSGSEDNIVLTVWESADGPDTFIKKASEEFSKKYPNIKINFVNVDSHDAAQQIAIDGPAGVGADVFAANLDKLESLVIGNHILPVANPNNIEKSLLAASKLGSKYNGIMYAYPIAAETYALYYNKALISEEEVPKTWEDLATWSAEFTKKNPEKYGFAMYVGNAYYTIIFASGYGNRLFGESGTDYTSSYLNTPEAIKGMEVFQNLRKVGIDVPSSSFSNSKVDVAFTSGNAAMAISGPWNIQPYANAGINYGVAPLPSMPGETTPSASFAGVRNMYVSAYTDYPEEAALFAEFLLSEEMQKLRYEITGALPAVKVDLDDSVAQGFLKQLDYAYPLRYGSYMDKFWKIFDDASAKIWDGADVKTELDAADAAIIN